MMNEDATSKQYTYENRNPLDVGFVPRGYEKKNLNSKWVSNGRGLKITNSTRLL